jgi:polyhydroxyalkanoate synthesis regulator phasin
MNQFEAALYAGLGLAIKGKEKIEEAARKFAAEQKMNSEDGQQFINDLLGNAEAARDKLTAKIEAIVKAKIAEAGFATKEEVDALKARIAELEGKE